MKLSSFGQHFIIALDGIEISHEDQERLKTLKPLGVFVDGDNFAHDLPYLEWLELFKNLINNCKELTERENLIVAIDHEGGRVHRTPPPLTKFPYAYDCINDVEHVADTISKELRSIGINLLFGPVADIHSNPENPVIGKRSFSDNPEKVIEACLKYINACKKNHLICSPKHFPGHGDTHQDSHYELPIVNAEKEVLYKRELSTFKNLCHDVDIIMSSHVIFPVIDSLPATLSKKILTDILRNEFQFSGVIVSDDMDMKAITNNFSEEEIVNLAINAGIDLFLFNHQPQRAIQMAEIMASNEKLIPQFAASKIRLSNFARLITPSKTSIIF